MNDAGKAMMAGAKPVGQLIPDRMSDRAAFYLPASLIVSFVASSVDLTPVDPIYQAEGSLSALSVTVVFAVVYLSRGTPAVMAGVAVSRGSDLLRIALELGAAVLLTIIVALVGAMVGTRERGSTHLEAQREQ